MFTGLSLGLGWVHEDSLSELSCDFLTAGLLQAYAQIVIVESAEVCS